MARSSGITAAVDFLRFSPWLTAARTWRIATVFIVILLAVLAWDFKSHTTTGLTDADGEQLARDFINFWSGARLAASGQLAQAYDTGFFNEYQRSLVGQAAEFKMYSYPPVAALLTLPLAALDFGAALALWMALGTALCIALLARTLPWRMAAVAVLASPAVFINAVSGQNGQFSAILFAGGVLLLERRPILSGVLFGALCYKPHLGVLLPFVLAGGGHWRAFASAVATVAVLIVASLALFGPEAWAEFFQQASIQRALMEQGYTFWRRMPTVFAAMRISGAGLPAAYAVHAISAIAAAIATIMIWRGNCRMIVKGAALIVGTLLVVPYAWDYDLVALTFVVAWLAHDAMRTGFLPWEKIALALLLVTPLFVGGLAKAFGVQFGPLVLWIALLLIVRRAACEIPASTKQNLHRAEA